MDKLTHAKHNESACHYLNKRQDLTDEERGSGEGIGMVLYGQNLLL